MNQPTRVESQKSDSSIEDVKQEHVAPVSDMKDAESGDYAGNTRVADIDEGYDPAFIRKVTRKIDWRLVPYLAAAYSISLIDRTNIALARAAGMQRDLRLDISPRYSVAVIMFFIPYILFELPSNIGLRKFGPAIWLSTAVTLWGVVLIGMAYVTTWNQLAATRALVGLFEAALFPGAALLVSCWYPRRSTQKRLSFFYSLSILATGLSSLLAYGLAQLNGRNGLAGWRWIFLVEGLITIAIGLVGYFVIIDFPDKAKILNEQEREMILTRIERDRADATLDKITWAKIGQYSLDWKLWLFAFMFFSSTTASYALSYFLPRILAGMGFTGSLATILVAPPYVFALIPAIGCAVLSDKLGKKSIFVIFNALMCVFGLALFAFLPVTNRAGRYAGIFFCAGGANANVPLGEFDTSCDRERDHLLTKIISLK